MNLQNVSEALITAKPAILPIAIWNLFGFGFIYLVGNSLYDPTSITAYPLEALFFASVIISIIAYLLSFCLFIILALLAIVIMDYQPDFDQENLFTIICLFTFGFAIMKLSGGSRLGIIGLFVTLLSVGVFFSTFKKSRNRS